jgi:transglutaminase/protease-like cytokinesis protein 3
MRCMLQVPAKKDVQFHRARAVYVWVWRLNRPYRFSEKRPVSLTCVFFFQIATFIAYDLDSFLARRAPERAADKVLAIRRTVCEGYCDLFKALCEAMGMPACTVGGKTRSMCLSIPPQSLSPSTKRFYF